MQALFLFHIKEYKQFDHRKEKNTMKNQTKKKLMQLLNLVRLISLPDTIGWPVKWIMTVMLL